MSPTPRPARAATRTAVAATVLLALAGTGLAASAVAPAVAATDAAPGAVARAAGPAPVSTGSLARVVPAAAGGADAGAARTTTKATTQRCTVSPAPSYTQGQVVQTTTFEDGASVLPWAADRDLDEPLVVSSAAAHSGTGGMRAADIGAATLVYPISSTRTVGSYLITFWVRQSPDLVHASGAHLQVFVYDDATNATLASLEPQISGEWTLVRAVVTPSVRTGICNQHYASAVKLVVYPVGPVCSDVAQLPLDIDDVSVAYAPRDATSTSTTASTASTEGAGGVVRPACTRPPTTTTTSKPPASSACKVKVTRVMSWPGGSQLQITVSSKARLSGWELTAKVGSAQTAAYAWPGAVSQSGTQLTFSPLAGYADPLAAQTPTKFGLVLSGSTLPTGWAINGQTCRVG